MNSIQNQKQQKFNGIKLNDGYRSLHRIYKFTYEYNEDQIEFKIDDYIKEKKVQIDKDFLYKQKARRKYGRTQNRKTKYASQLVDFNLVPFAQNILMTNKKQKCNWDKFGGYITFRDKYYDDGYHYQSRFLAQVSHMYSGCGCGYGDNSLNVGDKIQIVDLMPGMCDLTIIYSENPDYFKLEQSKFPQFISIDYNQEYYKKMEQYQVDNCLCPDFIKIIEKAEKIMYRILILLKAIKNQSLQYYNYLKSLRKDKLIEILSLKDPKLQKLIERTASHIPLSQNQQTQQQQFGIEYMIQQIKLKEEQLQHNFERKGPLGKIIQLYDKYYNENEDEDFNYEQQLQKEYPNHQQKNQEQIIQEIEQEKENENQNSQEKQQQSQKQEEEEEEEEQEEEEEKVYESFIYEDDDNMLQQYVNYDSENCNTEDEDTDDDYSGCSVYYEKDRNKYLEIQESENELEDLMMDSESDDVNEEEQNKQQEEKTQNLEQLQKNNNLLEKQVNWLLNYTNNLQKQNQFQKQLANIDINDSSKENQNNKNNLNLKRGLKQLYDNNFEGMQQYFNLEFQNEQQEEEEGIIQIKKKKLYSKDNENNQDHI